MMLGLDAPGDWDSAHLGYFCAEKFYPESFVGCVVIEIFYKFLSQFAELQFIHSHNEGDITIKPFAIPNFQFNPAFFSMPSRISVSFSGDSTK